MKAQRWRGQPAALTVVRAVPERQRACYGPHVAGSIRTVCVVSFVGLLAGTHLACSRASAPVQETPQSASLAHWSYSGDEGPQRWGDLDPTYTLCKTGGAQSPIDLPLTPSRREPAPARPHWDPIPLRLTNNGRIVQVNDTAPSSFVVDGTTYRLAQFHFHSPSDHTIAGHRYPVEMHLVHKSDAGKLLAVAIFFESGAENVTLAPLWSAMSAPADGSAPVVPGATVDVAPLLPSAPKYLRYSGSLTVPPCTEGVTWLVVEPDGNAQMSPDQIKTLHERTQPSTSRPLQPAGAREVVELVP
jgi:carbonic anhydrase